MVAQLVCHRRCRRKMKDEDDEVADYYVSTGRFVTVEMWSNLYNTDSDKRTPCSMSDRRSTSTPAM